MPIDESYEYLIDLQNEPCDKPWISLLTVVISAPMNVLNREVIRNTWGRAMKESGSMNMIFFMGRGGNETAEQIIQSESEQFGDIVQGDFIDSYRNLTLKGLYFMEWTLRNCSHVKWILKADDDVMINPYSFQRYLQRKKRRDSAIHGLIIKNATVFRDPENKWYTSESEFPDHNYPPYCQGTTYLLSAKTIRKLLQFQRQDPNPIFVWEDIYFTGILAKKARVKLLAMNSMIRLDYHPPVKKSLYFVGTHNINQDQLKNGSLIIWTAMTNYTVLPTI